MTLKTFMMEKKEELAKSADYLNLREALPVMMLLEKQINLI